MISEVCSLMLTICLSPDTALLDIPLENNISVTYTLPLLLNYMFEDSF